ncbi:unnamed protein product [Medioppia subpectinata]|uniref:Phosphomannomutase n=1 Tax=Medioppia subpectinata TaxID=1979941 RepID=A0A7R9KDA0_9ACAR|nr:unnamed protein product [Medioppia subpectinata]CAG2099979.1 unnamed protein product [Medioppia subpectinata]
MNTGRTDENSLADIPSTSSPNNDILFLFDVDGTLSPSRLKAPESILFMLHELKKKVNIAFVGGSDLNKQREQIESSNNSSVSCEDVLELFTYSFPENGVQFYKNTELIKDDSFIEKIEKRNCTQQEREEYFEEDKKCKGREKFVGELYKELKTMDNDDNKQYIPLTDIGWDKTYCIRHIKETTIVFFGDMVEKGGNDYEIYNHERIRGVRVFGPEDTLKKVNQELERLGIDSIHQ